jgi:RluA family pseudouridine synthase
MNPSTPSFPLRILFQDDHFIVVDKPAGQTVIPGRNLKDTLPPLVELVSKKIKKKAYVVHRLDRETSGLVVFAKDASTHRELCLLWEKREVKKKYQALVWGSVDPSEGMVEFPIKTFGSGRMGVDPAGKPSQTGYQVIRKLSRSTLLDVEPRTGRRHQIRVHFYQLGHPIMGDPLYGKERPVGGIRRLMLHASHLYWRFKNQEFNFTCEPGENFEEVLKEETGNPEV